MNFLMKTKSINERTELMNGVRLDHQHYSNDKLFFHEPPSWSEVPIINEVDFNQIDCVNDDQNSKYTIF